MDRSTNPYIATTTSILTKCKQMIRETWDLNSTVRSINLYAKLYDGCSIPCYKCSASVSGKKPADLMAQVWDVDEAKMQSIDPEILQWRIVESGVNHRVVHQRNKMKWPAWNRETIIVQSRVVETDAEWFVTHTIDQHPNVVLDAKNYVQAKVHLNCFGFVGGNGFSTIHKLTMVDPAGSIPTSVVTKYAGKMVNMLEYIVNA